jgi:hypothetical protein
MPVGLLSFGYNQVIFPATFLGNPDASISALDLSGGILSYWDSAQTTPRIPALVQVSASNFLGTGTSRPFEDLHFAWNFGDSGSAETFTRPTDGATVNSNSDQVGPEAVHCYRTAGTYTITCTAAGAGGNVVAQKTKTITIGSFTPVATYYLDSAATGSNNGLSAVNAFTDPASLNSILNTGTPGQTFTDILIRVAKGSNFAGKAGIKFGTTGNNKYSGIRIETYGSGSKPIFADPSDHNLKIAMQSSADTPFYDFVASGLDLRNTAVNNGACVVIQSGGRTSPAFNLVENVYFDNCDFSVTFDSNSGGNGAIPVFYASLLDLRPIRASGLWKCTVTNPDNSTTIGTGISGSSQEWFFTMGVTVSGNGVNNFDHHVYPDCRYHSLYKWSRFGKAGVASNRGFGINGNWDLDGNSPGVNTIVRWFVVSECETMGTNFSIDTGNRTNNFNTSDGTVQFTETVIERCAVHDHTGTFIFQLPCAKEVTVRGVRSWSNAAGSFFGPYDSGQISVVAQIDATSFRGYSNRLHIPATADNGPGFQFNATFAQPQQITRNIIRDFRTSGLGTIQFSFTGMAGGTVINRNQLFTSNSSSFITYNLSTGASYSTYTSAGWDANGTNTNPGWASTVAQWSDLN